MKAPPRQNNAAASARNTSAAPQINPPRLPSGGGAIRSISESFQHQKFTGAASLSIPLPTSPCRGFEPDLSVDYSSGSGNGPFGVGFRLSLSQISRNTEKRIPTYTDKDTFVLSEAGELVRKLRLAKDGWEVVQYTITEEHEWTVIEYRPRREQSFSKIEYRESTLDHATYWQVTDRNNVVHIFGKSIEARIFDPLHPHRVLTWLLESSADSKGNIISYEYRCENDANVRDSISGVGRDRYAQKYLHTVRYGAYTDPQSNEAAWHFEMVLDYGERDFTAPGSIEYGPEQAWPMRTDPFSTYRPGFELRTQRLCHAVLFYNRFPHLNEGAPQLIRALRFFYDQTPGMSFLTSVEEIGFRRTGAEIEFLSAPPLELNYSRSDPTYLFSIERQFAQTLESGPVPEPLRTEFRLNDTPLSSAAEVTKLDTGRWNITDGNRLYRLEINRITMTEQPESSLSKRSTTRLDVFAPAQQPVFRPLVVDGGAMPGFIDQGNYQMVDLDSEGLPGMLYADGDTVLYWKPQGNGVLSAPRAPDPFPLIRLHDQADTVLTDVAGNGLLDLEVIADSASGVYPRRPDGSWGEFLPYEGFPTEANVPGHVYVDTTGDGRNDLLISEVDSLRIFRSKGYRGYAIPESRPKPPGLPLTTSASGYEVIRFADMFGDGGSHLVRIRDGSIECWPNLGYGRFGPRVAFANAPHFAEALNPAQLFLADIDGSGTADIVYTESERLLIYFNQSGNGFSKEPMIVPLPARWDDEVASLNFADVLGNGTACAVLTTLDANLRAEHQYYDFTGGVKPHLLTEVDNSMGAVTRVHYTPSTRFYLEDQSAGRPWATKLPFPVQIVEKIETIDQISDTRQVQRFRYYDGYYDSVEREFRGFGMVETWDSERFDLFATSPDGAEIAAAMQDGMIVAPSYTKTWYQTGAFFEGELISRQYQSEYFQGDANAIQLPQQDFGPGVIDANPETLREAFASLEGQVLRQEVYGLDVLQNPDLVDLPYSVTQSSCHVRLLQPRLEQKHASFLTYQRESLTYTYERNPTDPRAEHHFTVEVDPWGNTLKSCSIYYPRRADVRPQSQNPADEIHAEQTWLRAVAEVDEYISELEQTYLLGVPKQQRSFELYGLTPGANCYFTFAEVAEQLHSALENIIPFDANPDNAQPQARLLNWSQQYYVDTQADITPLSQPLPFGEVSPQALLCASPFAIFPQSEIEKVFESRLTADDLTAAGYYFDQSSGYWWNPGVTSGYGAAEQSYLPVITVDPFKATTTARYDPFNLVVTNVTDAVGNRSMAEIDYQTLTLSPQRLVDINDNFSEVLFDPLGTVTASSIQGRVGEEIVGDAPLNEYQTKVGSRPVLHTPIETILENPAAYLQNASSFFAYDSFAWRLRRQPPCTVSLARTVHVFVRELSGTLPNTMPAGEILQSVNYFDGFGRAVQTKQKTNPGNAWTLDAEGVPIEIRSNERWLTSGRTVYNSKNAPVKKYEPYFTITAAYEPEAVLTFFGITPIFHYDPLLRLRRTDLPKGYLTKSEWTAWVQIDYDADDAILESSYYANRSQLDPEELAVLLKAAALADTPTQTVLDNLGRSFLNVQMLTRPLGSILDAASGRTAVRYLSGHYELDIQGNVITRTDPRLYRINQTSDSTYRNMSYIYDMAGNILFTDSADAGQRWNLVNAMNTPVLSYDSRGFVIRTEYDALQRKKQVSVKGDDGRGLSLNQVVEFVNYGDEPQYADPQAQNLRGRIAEYYDQAGKLTYLNYGLGGELLESTRQFRVGYREEASWQVVNGQVDPKEQLQPEIYHSGSAYDAVGRLVAEVAPDETALKSSSKFYYRYDPQSRITGVTLYQPEAEARVFVKDITYNARGQRTSARYGNNVLSVYEYDPKTFLMTRITSFRNANGEGMTLPAKANEMIQDLDYLYDPVGNVASVRFSDQTPIFHDNARVEPRGDYTYDSLYRLVEAKGREHPALDRNSYDPVDAYLPQPKIYLNDSDKLTAYTQHYTYDDGGNLRRLRHIAKVSDRCYTRQFPVAGPQGQPALSPSNRLVKVCTGTIPCAPTREGFTPALPVCQTVSYDANGNMETMEGRRRVYWNYRNNIANVPLVIRSDDKPNDAEYYVYDYAGRRVRRVLQRNTDAEIQSFEIEDKYYFGTLEILQRRAGFKDATGPDILKLERKSLQVRDGSDRIAIVHHWTTKSARTGKLPDAQIRYQFDDHLGSVMVELDEFAGMLTYEEYLPYGGTSLRWGRNQLDSALKEYRYSGKERDNATGLYYYGARYYAPWLCRWLSPDPAGTVDGLNLYAFVTGNPMTLTDAAGLNGSKKEKAKRKRDSSTSEDEITKKVTKKRKLTLEEAKDVLVKANQSEEALRIAGEPESYAGSIYAENKLSKAVKRRAKRKGGVRFRTSFGKTTITLSGTGQVMVSSRVREYEQLKKGKKAPRFTDYVHWARELDKTPGNRIKFAKDLLSAMTDNQYKPKLSRYTGLQQRAAALLVTTISTSEEYRVDAARKLGRAALRSIISEEKTFVETFGESGSYPMSRKDGGTAFTRGVMTPESDDSDSTSRPPTEDERMLACLMSPLRDTSGYESD